MIVSSVLALVLAAGGNGAPIQPGLPPATVACFGDSIFQGDFCTDVGELLAAGYRVFPRAIAGETANQIFDRVVSEAGTACVGEPCGTYFFNGAVNTLKIADYAEMTDDEVAELALTGDGASIHGTMDTADWLRANYPRAVIGVAGVLPFASCDAHTCPVLVRPGPRARAYNAKLQVACAARPWLRCAFPYADFEHPTLADHLKPAFAWGDGIHLSVEGRGELAIRVKTLRVWP